jgi:hypothetical protein
LAAWRSDPDHYSVGAVLTLTTSQAAPQGAAFPCIKHIEASNRSKLGDNFMSIGTILLIILVIILLGGFSGLGGGPFYGTGYYGGGGLGVVIVILLILLLLGRI